MCVCELSLVKVTNTPLTICITITKTSRVSIYPLGFFSIKFYVRNSLTLQIIPNPCNTTHREMGKPFNIQKLHLNLGGERKTNFQLQHPTSDYSGT